MPSNVLGKPIDPEPWNRNDGFSPGQLIVTKVPGLDTPKASAGRARRDAETPEDVGLRRELERLQVEWRAEFQPSERTTR